MYGLSERRLRVRATYVANLLKRGHMKSCISPEYKALEDEGHSLLSYLELIKEPIDKSTLKQVV